MTRRGLFVWLIVAMALTSTVHSLDFVDKRFGNIVIGSDTVKKPIGLYGMGVFLHEDTLCYFNPKLNQFLQFSLGPDDIIEGIKISYKGNSRCKSKVVFDEAVFQSSRGISLHSTFLQLEKLYGKPHKVKEKDAQLKAEYHTDYKKDPRVSLAYDAVYDFKWGGLYQIFVWDGE